MARGAVQAAQHATRRRSAHFLDVAAVPAQVLFLHTPTQANLPLKAYPRPTTAQHTGKGLSKVRCERATNGDTVSPRETQSTARTLGRPEHTHSAGQPSGLSSGLGQSYADNQARLHKNSSPAHLPGELPVPAPHAFLIRFGAPPGITTCVSQRPQRILATASTVCIHKQYLSLLDGIL